MIGLDSLVAYLSGGPCIAWVGSGPSTAMGLKSWDALAHRLLEEAARNKKGNFQRLEDHYRTKMYPQFFGEIERGYGREYLISSCRQELKEPDAIGDLYAAIGKLPFISYFTTNFDDLLFKHVSKNRAVKLYQNDKEDICSVEIHVMPSVVKLHGSLQIGRENTLVLTDDQYALWYEQGEKEYFRQFIQSHLATDRIVFIGYSLNDPEILYMQKRLAWNLRRKIPAIAILANATDTEVDYWTRTYNISVMSYAKVGEDHSELTRILSIAARFIGDSVSVRAVKPDESRLAQKFYFWHKFEQKAELKTKIDALKSVILMTANEIGGDSFSCGQIVEALKGIIATDGERFLDNISKCCAQLVTEGWLVSVKGRYRLGEETKELVGRYSHQYEDLIAMFVKQIQLDIRATTGIENQELLDKTANVILETICDIFMIRGGEIVNLAFSNTPVPIGGANDVLSVIWGRAVSLGDMNMAFAVTNYVVDLLTRPQGVAEQVIDYLSKAFFSMQALRMQAGDEDLINEFYRKQSFLIDENVLIPLIAVGDARHDLCLNAVRASVEKGIFLFTTDYFAHEVFRHGSWAEALIEEYGEQSSEVLMAARGEGEYSANAFLDGYIAEWERRGEDCSFGDYLAQCTDGAFTDANIWSKLRSLGIGRLNKDQTRGVVTDIGKLHDAIESFIATEVAWRQAEKSRERIEREADAYTIIHQWAEFTKLFGADYRPQCSFLTFATALATVALRGPFPIGRSILASPQALYELVVRYFGEKEKEVSIGSVLRSSYFRTAGQFIDKEKYADFFAPLIGEFHRTFTEHYELYRRFIESKLTRGIINEYDPIDRVNFVSSLERRLESIPSTITGDNEQLREENAILKKRIRELLDRERKRLEYVNRQKQESREKKRRGK